MGMPSPIVKKAILTPSLVFAYRMRGSIVRLFYAIPARPSTTRPARPNSLPLLVFRARPVALENELSPARQVHLSPPLPLHAQRPAGLRYVHSIPGQPLQPSRHHRRAGAAAAGPRP